MTNLIPSPTFLKPDQPRKTHCPCGKPIPNPNVDQVAPHMHWVPAYSCSTRCHNDSILGINAFEGNGHPVGDGWMPIVLEAHEKFLALDPDYEINQIKEKFGGLRYYVSQSNRKSHRPRVTLTSQEWYALSNLIWSVESHWKAIESDDPEAYGLKITKDARHLDNIDLLRRLLDRSNDQFRQIERDAERKSEETCEVCGEPGKRDTTEYWVMTVCEDHAKMRKDGLTIGQMFQAYKAAKAQHSDDPALD